MFRGLDSRDINHLWLETWNYVLSHGPHVLVYLRKDVMVPRKFPAVALIFHFSGILVFSSGSHLSLARHQDGWLISPLQLRTGQVLTEWHPSSINTEPDAVRIPRSAYYWSWCHEDNGLKLKSVLALSRRSFWGFCTANFLAFAKPESFLASKTAVLRVRLNRFKRIGIDACLLLAA